MKAFEKVFVLGGTSEIAQEICINLIKKGTKVLHLVSNNQNKNETFAKFIKTNYKVKVSSEEHNLLNFDLETLPNVEFFDLYIIAAGHLGNAKLAIEDHREALKIARINYYGIIPWISSITSNDRISKPGSIWILSSVAADLGRPSNYHYGASKSALTIFCQGLFYRCNGKPFKVRIIKAGLINTNMSRGLSPKILYASKKYFAKYLLRKPNKDGIEYFPWWWFWVIKVILFLPKTLISKL